MKYIPFYRDSRAIAVSRHFWCISWKVLKLLLCFVCIFEDVIFLLAVCKSRGDDHLMFLFH